MTETIKYGLIGKQDLALRAVGGSSNFSVTLPDGSVVTIDRLALSDLIAFGAVDINLQQLQNVLAEIRTANPTTETQGRFWYISGVIRYSNGTTALEIVELAATQTLTNKTLTSPRIGTAILDSNGNEIIELSATATAVNQFKVTNAIAGGTVIVEAAGDSANINLDIRSKGTGNVTLNGTSPVSLPSQSGNANKFLQTDGSATAWAEALRAGAAATITGVYTFTTAPSIANPDITGASPVTPVANRLYTDSIIKAWANILVSGGVPSFVDELNGSTLTDNGVGDYTFVFATAMANANYAASGMTVSGSNSGLVGDTYLSASIRYRVRDFNANTNVDASHSIMIVGDQ